ncbi:uncharacterized protein ARMOST_19536 [Armillaria ostoyae]|uniref:Uncharacterized protein n=1 Tax=Armillaria ostoyae TaxID=47428 RepID=A0A284S4S8_ARMOS|nr:uncharacterized protein ARMOST_19536 [Armillaria ostoyae]
MFSRILILLPLVALALAFADPLAPSGGIAALQQDFNATDEIVGIFQKAYTNLKSDPDLPHAARFAAAAKDIKAEIQNAIPECHKTIVTNADGHLKPYCTPAPSQ